MARKKKCNLTVMILIALATLLVLGYITKQGYENFTNTESFESFRDEKSCGTCKAGDH